MLLARRKVRTIASRVSNSGKRDALVRAKP
jgi:hypothetical protein